MKPVFKIILWVFSGAFALMALLFLLVSALSGAMLLGCAVLLSWQATRAGVQRTVTAEVGARP